MDDMNVLEGRQDNVIMYRRTQRRSLCFLSQQIQERFQKTIFRMMGDRLQWADKQFRRELAAWARPAHGKESHDGLPGYTQSKGSFATSISPFLIRTFDMGDEEAIKDHLLATGSSALAVLGTFNDTWHDWLAAGQAVQKLLLYACTEGVQGSFLNQPVEFAPLRSILRDLIGRGAFPQLVLRLGYGPTVPPTPRRSVSEVLLL